ncbi:hypothetical protein Tco_0344171 [Tanacetum coccineum]
MVLKLKYLHRLSSTLQRQRERKLKHFAFAIHDEYPEVSWNKMQKGLDKAYDRFQKLISLLEVHGATVPNEDANQKFLRALPSSWKNVALIMRNKDSIDDLDINDLYNNLKVFEADIKGSSGSSSNSQNVAFLSIEDTSSSNEVNTANVNRPQLDDEGLAQIEFDDLEKCDLKWECRAPRNQGNMNGDAGYRSRDNTKRIVPMETSDALLKMNQLSFLSWPTLQTPQDLTQSQISSKDKTGLGYGDQLNENDSSGSELFNSVFDSRSSDDNQTNDRFKKGNKYHAVPLPLTRNYMPPLADLSFAGLDDSIYRPTTNKTSASVSQVEASNTPPSNTSVEMPRVESFRPSGVIIEDWVSDDEEDIFQSEDS